MLEFKVVTASRKVLRQLDFLDVRSQAVYDSLEILGRVKASAIDRDYSYNRQFLIARLDGVVGLVELPRNSWGNQELAKHQLVIVT